MIRIKVQADTALFKRPEMLKDSCSYDMITPSAACGLMECIYWHPGIIWIIDRIFVLNPIRFEFTDKDPSIIMEGSSTIMVLKDVSYIIEAHFEMSKDASSSDNPVKFSDIIRRRLQRADYYRPPYLGSKEYPAEISRFTGRSITTAYRGTRDLGYMLYQMCRKTPGFSHGDIRRSFLSLFLYKLENILA